MSTPATGSYDLAASDLRTLSPRPNGPQEKVLHRMETEGRHLLHPRRWSLTEPYPRCATVAPSLLRGRTADVAGAAIDVPTQRQQPRCTQEDIATSTPPKTESGSNRRLKRKATINQSRVQTTTRHICNKECRRAMHNHADDHKRMPMITLTQ